MKIFKRIGSKILDILFPKHIKCVFCGEELNENAVFDTCELCFKTLPFITKPCARCGVQTKGDYSDVCFACFNTNRNFVQAKSVFDYSDKVVSVVHKFKYNSKHYLAEPIVSYISAVFNDWDFTPNLVCEVPMHKAKLKKRKVNHGTILATMFANTFNLKYLPLCEKIKDNPSQASLKFVQRKENVKGVYAINKQFANEVKGKSVLIVDDVITTCSTIDELSKVLLEAGADSVYAISFAHTNLENEES